MTANLTDRQRREYDSLHHAARTDYDRLRASGLAHKHAIMVVFNAFGQSQYYLNYVLPKTGTNVLEYLMETQNDN